MDTGCLAARAQTSEDMTARLIDGKKIAEEVRTSLKGRVANFKGATGRAPKVAVVIVGEDPASQIYVRLKRADCAEVGIDSLLHELPAEMPAGELYGLIQRLNHDDTVDGILLQNPLPHGVNPIEALEVIRADKDVDGFHPYNLGMLALRRPVLRCCTPKGVMHLIDSTSEPILGKRALVIGASNHVGRPMALELLLAGCTVTVAHRFTSNLEELVRDAEVLVSASGQRQIVKGDWIRPGAIVVDVTIVRDDDGRLYGDVEFTEASKRASWITPVPGGVGPMTRAALLQNTLIAAERRLAYQNL